MVDNEPGVLARVVGLFSGRGYNIESLSVSEVDSDKFLSRVTIVTSGNKNIIDQIKAQLLKLIPVHNLVDISELKTFIGKELILIKLDVKKKSVSKIYKYGSLCYVGGGMGKSGLHNILEPSIFGLPIIIGMMTKRLLTLPEQLISIKNQVMILLKCILTHKKD